MNTKSVGRHEWEAARIELLKKEKEFTRLRDELNRQRRELPRVKIEKHYQFESKEGTKSLSALFSGKRQLIVYHFMFAPDWKEGCSHCSFWADNFNEIDLHLGQRDTAFVAISRAPMEKLQDFKKRMGWKFSWVSSGNCDFNFDFGVSFKEGELKSKVYNCGTQSPDRADREGVSVFFKDEDGAIYHTYSAYSRGIDLLNTTYNYLDLTPLGRNEEQSPGWIKHHDKYLN